MVRSGPAGKERPLREEGPEARVGVRVGGRKEGVFFMSSAEAVSC
jgi:hypothetical protein